MQLGVRRKVRKLRVFLFSQLAPARSAQSELVRPLPDGLLAVYPLSTKINSA
jgi:hypothetical protein